MVAQSVILAPHLSAWHVGGVDFLLQDAAVAEGQSLCHRQRLAPPSPAPQRPQTHAPRPPQAAQQHAPPQNASVQARPQSMPPHMQAPPQAAQQHAPPQNAPVQARPQSMPPQAMPFVELNAWPAPWQQRFAATSPALALWTYWSLGEDFSGTPNTQRRALLQGLLQALRHPAGTHGFWPITLPNHSGELEARVDIFWSGARMLKSRVIVVMGEEAYTALNLQGKMSVNTFRQHMAYRLCLVPDVHALMQSEQLYKNTLALLQTQLAPLTRMRAQR